jgi:hypothetical protein
MESRDPVKRWIIRHKVWTGILGAVAALMIVGAISGTSDTTSTSSSSSSNTYYDPGNTVESSEDTGYGDSSSYDSGSSYSSESSGQENAREQAESYLSHTAFSRKGLIEQLKYEGYSTADATYAVDAVDVDWYEQAVLKARSYLDGQSFSRSGLQEQLEYEGFTSAQAAHGVSVAY